MQTGLVQATQVAREVPLRHAANGIFFGSFGETQLVPADLERMVQAVPSAVAGALDKKAYFFVPLALAETDAHRGAQHPVMISSTYTAELSEDAICHRNASLDSVTAGLEGVFISTRLLNDKFALCFEFFINVAHAFVETVGVPESFAELAWTQALADVRGETSQDAWESRTESLAGEKIDGRPRVDEKAKSTFLDAAFSDTLAIYQLSLAVDFDYSELREREYPLIAPAALADRLRLVAKLFPPNAGYEFSIRYRRRA